ncbi:MAG: hypothetical protein KatS3mg010_0037 [Acidimicrobiia bacterium]|nr:MAG: hypothetical protein KatS3mg010_0037 [Acidimicrobiia bacterium]
MVSTSITLDGEAVAEVERNGRTLESAILLDDLRAAGWEAAWERRRVRRRGSCCATPSRARTS